MNLTDKSQILSQMEPLKCIPFFSVARFAAGGNLCFKVPGSETEHYYLRPQCAWRVRTSERILIANLDVFEPNENTLSSPSFEWDTFDWDVMGANLYDAWAKEFTKVHQGKLIAKNISVNDFGDLTIEFDNDIFLEIFMNDSIDECWRFFERKSEKRHLVVCGNGLEKYDDDQGGGAK